MAVLAYTWAFSIDELSHVLTFTKLRYGSEGHSFHFKQVLFQLMQTWVRYGCNGQTEGQTAFQLYIVDCTCAAACVFKMYKQKRLMYSC